MTRDRNKRAAATASLVLVVMGLSATFVSVAQADSRPREKHLWNAHLEPQARGVFARKEGVKKRIRIAIQRGTPAPPPGPPESPTNGGDPTPPPSPSPDDPNDDDGLDAALFGWMDAGGWDENWPEGLLYVVLGFVGALVTAFFYLHDFLPSVGGTAEYREVSVTVAEREEMLDQLRKAREDFAYGKDKGLSAERLAELNRLYDHRMSEQRADREWLRAEKRRSYRAALPMYVILGGAFAVLFATNPLQGVLIGFGWTAIADRAGLKRQAADREQGRDKQIEKIEKVASEKVQEARHEAERAKLEGALQVQEAREKLRALRDNTSTLARLAREVPRRGATEPEDVPTEPQ